VLVVGYLMVSTWRFYSFKDIHFVTRQPFRLILLLAALFVSLWYWSRWVLFGVALIYMFSGVWWRLQWIIRRKPRPPAPPVYHEISQPS
jgi:CDP-diacylglycerol--serine O-phosphatidyltransferase